jgi:hypothetical protein
MGTSHSVGIASAAVVAVGAGALYLRVQRDSTSRCSTGELDDKRSSSDWFEERMRADLVYLDESRLRVVRDAACTLDLLVDGRLVGANRFRRLVLGRKGVGKSTLLKQLARCARERFGKRELVTVELKGSSCNDLPVDVICRACGVRLRQAAPGESRVDALDAALEAKRLFVFLLLDEVQHIFARHPAGGDAIAELTELGDSDAGRVHVIMTGSGSVARRLCFGKLRMGSDEALQYRWYSGCDMNSTKYNAVTIYPFLGPDFVGALDAMRRGCGRSLDQATAEGNVTELYLQTSGVASTMVAVLNKGDVARDGWSGGLRSCAADELQLLQCVADSVVSGEFSSVAADSEGDASLDSGTGDTLPRALCGLSSWTSLDTVLADFARVRRGDIRDFVSGSNGPGPRLFDLIDAGFLHLRLHGGGLEALQFDVRFGGPVLALDVMRSLSSSTSEHLGAAAVLSLRHPVLHLSDLAEQSRCE